MTDVIDTWLTPQDALNICEEVQTTLASIITTEAAEGKLWTGPAAPLSDAWAKLIYIEEHLRQLAHQPQSTGFEDNG